MQQSFVGAAILFHPKTDLEKVVDNEGNTVLHKFLNGVQHSYSNFEATVKAKPSLVSIQNLHGETPLIKMCSVAKMIGSDNMLQFALALVPASGTILHICCILYSFSVSY